MASILVIQFLRISLSWLILFLPAKNKTRAKLAIIRLGVGAKDTSVSSPCSGSAPISGTILSRSIAVVQRQI